MIDDPNAAAPGGSSQNLNDVERSDGRPELDAHARRNTLDVAPGFAGLCALWLAAIDQLSLIILSGGALDGSRRTDPADAWTPIRAADTMLVVSACTPYALNPDFLAMPGFAALHVPLSTISRASDLPTLDYEVGRDAAQVAGSGNRPSAIFRMEATAAASP